MPSAIGCILWKVWGKHHAHVLPVVSIWVFWLLPYWPWGHWAQLTWPGWFRLVWSHQILEARQQEPSLVFGWKPNKDAQGHYAEARNRQNNFWMSFALKILLHSAINRQQLDSTVFQPPRVFSFFKMLLGSTQDAPFEKFLESQLDSKLRYSDKGSSITPVQPTG